MYSFYTFFGQSTRGRGFLDLLSLSEVQQLSNIDTNTISKFQWQVVSNLDQYLSKLSSPEFVDIYSENYTLESVGDDVKALYDIDLDGLTLSEVQQLQNIGAETISATQWGYLGGLDQPLISTASPSWVNISSTNYDLESVGDDVGALYDIDLDGLTLSEVQQLQNIGAETISATQWGYLGEMDQSLTTNSNVSFIDLTITGDLYVGGTTTTVDSETVQVADNIMLLNYGEPGAGCTNQYNGLEIDRGTLTNYQFVYDETADAFKVGEAGSLQICLTRQDAPTDGGIFYYNSTAYRADNSPTLTLTEGATTYLTLDNSDGPRNNLYFQTKGGSEYRDRNCWQIYNSASNSIYVGHLYQGAAQHNNFSISYLDYTADIGGTYYDTPFHMNSLGNIRIQGKASALELGTYPFSVNGTAKADYMESATTADMEMTGFKEWTGSGVYWSVAEAPAGTFTFTLERGGSGYIKSKLVEFAGSQSHVLTNYTANCVFITSAGVMDICECYDVDYYGTLVLFEVFCNGSIYIVKWEGHPYRFQTDISRFLHRNVGSVIQGDGAIISASSTTTIAITGDDFLEDHGLISTISADDPIEINYMYKNASGHWVRYSQATTVPQVYNNAGTIDDLGTVKYAVYRVGVGQGDLNSVLVQYYAIIHTEQFSNQASAESAISEGSISWVNNELEALELAQLGYVLVKQGTGIQSVIVEKSSFTSKPGGGVSTNSHLLLSDINGGQYLSGGHTYLAQRHEEADDPDPATDDTDNYKTLTLWRNTGTNDCFICADATDGSAVWRYVGSNQRLLTTDSAIFADVSSASYTLETVGADLDALEGFITLTAEEIAQLGNIDTTTISTTQWGYLGELDQPLISTASPSWVNVSSTSYNLETVGDDVKALYDIDLDGLTLSEVQQLQNIGTETISATQWGYLGELDQSLITTATPKFSKLALNGLPNAPDVGLHLCAPTNKDGMTLESYDGVAFAMEKSNGLTENYGMYMGRSGSGWSWIQCGRTDADTAYSLILQLAGGGVGIGTSSLSDNLLSVAGNIRTSDNIRIDETGSGTQGYSNQFFSGEDYYHQVDYNDVSSATRYIISGKATAKLEGILLLSDYVSTNGEIRTDTITEYTPDHGVDIDGTTIKDGAMTLYDNSSNTTTCGLTIEQAGTGDAICAFLLTGVRRWVVGCDNSDSDAFKITPTQDLGSDAVLTITTGGIISIPVSLNVSIINEVGSSGCTVEGVLMKDENILTDGYIRSTLAGSVLKMYDTTTITGLIASTGDNLTTVNYTPVSNSSYLRVVVDFNYEFVGSGSDVWTSTLYIDGTARCSRTAKFNNASGGGGRARNLAPISFPYENSSVSAKAIYVAIVRTSGDDSISTSDHIYSITEYAR